MKPGLILLTGLLLAQLAAQHASAAAPLKPNTPLPDP